MPSLAQFSCCHIKQESQVFDARACQGWASGSPGPRGSCSTTATQHSEPLCPWLQQPFQGQPSQKAPPMAPLRSHFGGCLICSQHPLSIMHLTCQCAWRDIVSLKFAIYIFMSDIIEEWMLLWKLNLWFSRAAVTLLKCNVIFDASSWGFIK